MSPVIDEDTTDAFLDLDEPRYGPYGKTAAQIAADEERFGIVRPVERLDLPPLSSTLDD